MRAEHLDGSAKLFVLCVVQRGERIELRTTVTCRVTPAGIVQIQNRVALAAQQYALMFATT